jgi:hypothetical protein
MDAAPDILIIGGRFVGPSAAYDLSKESHNARSPGLGFVRVEGVFGLCLQGFLQKTAEAAT